ncbi:ROK family protein [Candidatus Bathyarchaeota archaeon]|nr:MAG: ROK family protein [Candidatus Bathyarchaeota archaeon]
MEKENVAGLEMVKPKMRLNLDPGFSPVVLYNHAFLNAVRESGEGEPLGIAIERNNGLTSIFKTMVFAESSEMAEANLYYVERLVKTLLWMWGGWRIVIGGAEYIGQHIRNEYSIKGKRSFDAEFMSGVYEKPFTVEVVDFDDLPQPKEETVSLGGHLDGCRIGFDAGASDMKVAAVIDGKVVFSKEIVWDPKHQSDPQYHFSKIMSALRMAASHMPRVDAIGVSAAGIYIKNRVRVASLFRGVPPDLFKKKVQNLFLDIKREWGGIPLEVVNDGDVAALAGAMALNDTNVLGIALGSSEAGGYIDSEGYITGWLNELAFVPVDLNPQAPIDEWSGDRGCGAQYFSQEAAIRLAKTAGISLDSNLTPAEKLKHIQKLLAEGDEKVREIFETIGYYMGYGIAHYADFYDIKHVLILGRVTSGEGGNIILEKVNEVLKVEFPDLADQIKLHLPDESIRRVGQAIAAASLPALS